MRRIVIIKLGADGDVIRTLPLARALKDKYPDSEITWITKGDVAELIVGVPYIDKIFVIPYESEEKYDMLYNFDVEEEATKLAASISADEKYGFYYEEGYPAAFNIGAEYYLTTMFDDDLKKKNRKTYQEMMFDAAELTYHREFCPLFLNEEDMNYAENFAKMNYLKSKNLIGIHMGASSRWPSKVWSEDKIKEFIIKAKQKGYEILLFGGPNETQNHDKMVRELENNLSKVYRNDPTNSKREFVALVSLCKVMVCSDSFSMHVSLAMQKLTVGLFFCTSPWEVEDYGLLKKVVSPMEEEFFPEKMDKYDEKLVNSISADEVMKVVESIK